MCYLFHDVYFALLCIYFNDYPPKGKNIGDSLYAVVSIVKHDHLTNLNTMKYYYPDKNNQN